MFFEKIVVFVAYVWPLAVTLAALQTAPYDEPFVVPTCPSISSVSFEAPYCKCRYGPDYDVTTNTCPDASCPTKSIAEPSYPNCTCTEVNFSYSEYTNDCFRVCPENSSGYWPNCECDDKLAGFDKSTQLHFQV